MATQIKELPEWFDLRNYTDLLEIKNGDRWKEIEYRIDILNGLKENKIEIIECFYKHYLSEIFVGHPALDKVKSSDSSTSLKPAFQKLRQVTKKTEPYRFEVQNNYVIPLSLMDALCLSESIQDINIHEPASKYYEQDGSNRALESMYKHASKTIKFRNDSTKRVAVDIDIENATDEELTHELLKLVKCARAELGVKPRAFKVGRKGDKKSDSHKINDYKIIPLLDLLIWERINNKLINREVIARELFADSKAIVTSKNLHDTIFPFIDTISSKDYKWPLTDK